MKGGCTLFDIEQLKRENSADDFKNLFMCEFVDDKASVFPFEELQRCMVDTLEEWEDYAPFAANPFGSRPVWIGYDPSHRGDSAGCVVLAPPVVAGGKFRILERHQWKGMDFATQAESIRKLTEKYNVEYIGIDATGLGVGVFQLVRSFYPAARDIRKPENVGSLGDIEKVAKVFVRNELIPLQDRIREINGWLGQEVIRFKNYSLDTDNG
ncbi:phage terminase large subunit [Escherichia coli]|nr:phage terminase large subunit [Escherichia coli]